jgi:capsular polysaccharide biosynthesis protein
MSQEALDLQEAIKIVRRRKIVVGAVMALGLLGGVAYPVIMPPLYTGTALVVLAQPPQSSQASGSTGQPGQPDSYTATQEVIAGSNEVLSMALPHTRPVTSLQGLRNDVQINSVTPYIITISATGRSTADVEQTVNAVANSYVSYVGSSSSPVGHVSAKVLQPATSATRPSLIKQLITDVLLGILIGAVVGIVGVLAISRKDRRLRERDDIANSIGVPVIASLAATRPKDAAEWAKLLGEYAPTDVNAWQLRHALQLLGMPDSSLDSRPQESADNQRRAGFSVTVLSVSSDRTALAIGPQLAVFAASCGIRTELVVGPQPDTDAAVALRTACAAAPSADQPRYLRIVAPEGRLEQADAFLTVVVAVVDERSPRFPPAMRTAATLLGVSAGATTPSQLARTAMSAADDGREITGILVANPESTDRTTGRIPQWPRRRRSQPSRMNGVMTETIR